MGHQDTKLTSMRPRLKELNDIPYLLLLLQQETMFCSTILTIIDNYGKLYTI